MKSIPNLIVATLLLIAFGMSFFEFRMNLEGETLSEGIWGSWSFLYVVLVGTWVLYDKKSGNFDRPFDFGLFLYLFLPVLLLYYLIRSRGHEGVVTYMGFFSIYWLPEFFGLVAYAYYY
ncbi:hypothetical protein E4634_20880 [Mangrovimicrobium sediminis]|uniref:Uncharacterized protein n=1 Tax=Mangrovimicrobium sediminis TaxID=2562682 RepID=A0A4Z0LTU9_9GAMM|nr:hypothetical protein [Haliea sp. SAOS-164]TGD70674.1 hypothetical protein E4634_20880 [Haliea sp. SAOS-164]